MFKFICIFALVALSCAQDGASTTGVDVSQVATAAADLSDALNDAVTAAQGNPVVDAVNSTLGGLTVGQAGASLPELQENLTQVVNVTALPLLTSVTVEYGNESVVLTPANSNATNEDWLNNNEDIDVEKASADNGENEWQVDWSVEDSGSWSLFNQDGNLVLVATSENGTVSNYSLGNNSAVNDQIAEDAELLVNAVYDSNVSNVTTDQVREYVNNLVNDAIGGSAVQGFLAQNGQSVDSSLAEVAQSAVGSAQGNVDTAQEAVSSSVGDAVQDTVAPVVDSAQGTN